MNPRLRIAALLLLVVLCGVGALWLAYRRDRPAENRTETSTVTATGPGTDSAVLQPVVPAGGKTLESIAEQAAPQPAGRETETNPDAARESVEVLVTDLDGRPVSDAHVRTFEDSAPGEYVTDPEGRCRIQVPPERTGRLMLMAPGRMIRVRVDAAGFFHSDSWLERKSPLRAQLAKSAVVRGRVLDADSHAPIVNALVAFAHDCKDCGPQRTDAEGRFAVEVTAGRQVWLDVRIADGTADRFAVQTGSASDGGEQDLLIRHGTEFRGTVVDLVSGAPISGAGIRDEAHGAEVTQTGADGTFVARILPSDSTNQFQVGVQAQGYCTVQRAWTVAEFAQALPLSVELPKPSGIDGFVHDQQGKGVGNLTLLIGPDVAARIEGRCELEEMPARLRAALKGWRIGIESAMDGACVRTDAAGRFLVSNLLPWMSCYRIFSLPNQVATVEIVGGPLGGPGEVTHVEGTAEVIAFGRVTGRLLLNGNPIRGQLGWEGATRSGFGATARDGRFALEAVEAGKVVVDTARSTGESNGTAGLREHLEIEVRVGETLEHDFDLVLPMAKITGRVATPRGAPVVGALIFLHAANGDRLGFQADTHTDADGTWSLDVPANLAPCAIQAGSDRNPPKREGVLPGATGIDFILPGTDGRLRVRVVDSVTRTPIPNPEMCWSSAGTAHWELLGSGPRFVADSDGWYSAELAPGSIDLCVAARHLRYPYVLVRDVQIPLDAKEASVEVALEKGIGITLQFAPGQEELPDKRIQLTLVEPEEARAANRSLLYDERNAYVGVGSPYYIPRLRPHRYRFVIRNGDGRIEPAEIDVQKDGQTFEIRWRPK